MIQWDHKFKKKLTSLGINTKMYARYVDDSRTFMNGIRKGWRWVEDKFQFNSLWESQDTLENRPDEARTVSIMIDAMNSIMSFLNFTGEAPNDFPDCRLPTLDCNIFL